jgi:hypothetical protein
VRFAVVIAVLLLLDGCSSLPPILQRWAGLEIATVTLHRSDTKVSDLYYAFSEDGLVEMPPKKGAYLPGPKVLWKVRGEWLEIDTTHDGTFQTRMRPLKVTSERIVAESPEGKKSVWDYTWVTVVTGMEERKPSGVWMW